MIAEGSFTVKLDADEGIISQRSKRQNVFYRTASL
jgi:hypothetical protein